jgi:hypothetical protein
VDLVSCRGAVEAARAAGVQHFIYVSVAQPAPVMKAYIRVRSECEAMICQSGMNSTILRPWYVLGPGHPLALLPAAHLQADGNAAPDSRGSHAPRTGYVGTDVPRSAACRRSSVAGRACRRSPGNPLPWLISEEVDSLSAGADALRPRQTKVTTRITKAHAHGTSVRC